MQFLPEIFEYMENRVDLITNQQTWAYSLKQFKVHWLYTERCNPLQPIRINLLTDLAVVKAINHMAFMFHVINCALITLHLMLVRFKIRLPLFHISAGQAKEFIGKHTYVPSDHQCLYPKAL